MQNDTTPRPDPTERTREELLREIEHLRELVEAKLLGHTNFATTRHADLTKLVQERIDATERLFDLHLNEARHQLQDQITAERRQTEAALVSATEATRAALDSANKAIDKAAEANKERFASVNEFRQQLSDQNATFLRREMFDQHVREAQDTKDALRVQIQTNTTRLVALTSSETGGKDQEAQTRATAATVLAVIATLVAVATFVMTLTT